MSINQPIQKLNDILSVAQDIRQSDLPVETQYDMIFSEKISIQAYSIFKELGQSFDYYDPDTSYEEDMDYYIRALSEHISNLHSENNNELINRYHNL
jgi:predicted RNA-binding protein with EMAP domain